MKSGQTVKIGRERTNEDSYFLGRFPSFDVVWVSLPIRLGDLAVVVAVVEFAVVTPAAAARFLFSYSPRYSPAACACRRPSLVCVRKGTEIVRLLLLRDLAISESGLLSIVLISSFSRAGFSSLTDGSFF